MPDRYYKSTGSNTAPYDTWVKAATAAQTIIDLAVAGDTNHYSGTINAILDVDTNSGAIGSWIKHIGHNNDAAPVLDGTRVLVDGAGVRANCIGACDKNYHWWENFEFTRATGDGVNLVDAPDPQNWVFKNCISHTNGADGWGGDGGAGTIYYIRCKAYNNTARGWDRATKNARVILCACYGNGTAGLYEGNGGTLVLNSLFYDNGDVAQNCYINVNAEVINNVFDGTNQANSTGLLTKQDGGVVMFNRFTNCTIGLDADLEFKIVGYNYFHDNTADTANAVNLELLLNDLGLDTNEYDVDVDDGYNNAATADYNLKDSRTYNGNGDDTVDLGVGV